MNEKVKHYQLRLFNRLFSILPSVKKLNTVKNELKLKEPISHIYYYHNRNFWFSKGESDDKYVFIFGVKNKAIHEIAPEDATLIIDFDKNKQYNDNSLGIFSIKNSEIHICINHDILNKRYPYFNINNLKITNFQSIDKSLKLNLVDLGDLNSNFIENFEKLLIESENFMKKEENKPKPFISSENCEICLKKKKNFKIDSQINNLKNIRPDLCGKCIEKIVAAEFYDKVKALLKGNDTKILDIAKEKFGNDQLFDYGLKLLEKYKIIQFIGVKKLYYTLDTNPYLVSKYKKYSDKNNLLIDNIFQAKKTKSKKKEISIKNTSLTKKTINKMNLFLNALQSGKTFDKACKKAQIDEDRVETWYSLGEKGYDDYKEFFINCKTLMPDGVPKNKSEKIIDNNKLMNEFIALIDDGKTNKDAIEQLKIPKFKVKNWLNQGELGNKKYVNFYNSYMIEINNKELKYKEEEKPINISKELLINNEIISSDSKLCRICGRTLKNSTKDICKRCARKQYASKILIKLLNSIDSGIAFKKEDLKILGLESLQIQDYIWTLQEFNLITKENNNKFKLKNREILDKFIENSGIEIDETINENKVKLNKTCKTCGKNLEISKFSKSENTSDGYDDNCKNCKRLISAASYLKEITEIIAPEENFTEDDLKPYLKNQVRIRGKIWLLMDNDLVKRNLEDNTYILTDEKTISEFLNKYYVKKEDAPKETSDILRKDTHEYTKKDQMDIVIKSISDGKSRREAAKLAEIPLYKITHWYNEGRQGYGKKNVEFYKKLKTAEKNNENKIKDLENKMNYTITELKNDKPLSNLTYVDEIELNKWIEKGKENIEPYSTFYNEYTEIESTKRNRENEYYDKEINRKIFLENFRTGKTKEESSENADINLSLINEWYQKGKHGEEPYSEFYEKYISIKNPSINTKIPQIEKTDKFGSSITVSQMNVILEKLATGMSEEKAVENAQISFNTYKYWLNRGKQGFGELYAQFYNYVNQIKNGDYKISEQITSETNSSTTEQRLDEILTPLPKKYEESFKSSKMNKTGIAWVNIIGKQWVYQKNVNHKTLKINNSNIYKLYDEVKENNLPWGVRDISLARKTIIGNEELNIDPTPNKIDKKTLFNEPIDPDIYAPLPEEYEDSFKSNPMNKSGIAWVNNPGTGKKWIYEKRTNGNIIRIIDENIYRLHKKVKEQNQIWGIRDYSRAKKIIDIPEDFEIPKRLEIEDKSKKIPEYINPEIYAPLSKELELTFNPNQPNKTGIAWVNKSGSNWRYSRTINKIPMAIVDENIYELFNKVKKQNLDWGIRDYQKAKEIIKIPENFVPAKEDEEDDKNTDILAPLPEKYKISFNQNQPNKTGIAWVNQIGHKWVYQRKVNGIPIKFSDSDIHKLHEIVIKNNHVWGILDLEKAKPIIDNNKLIENEPENSISRNVTVTYIDKGNNITDILIKGIIGNTEFIKIINQLDIFEEDLKRIITTSLNDKLDLFIELEINNNRLHTLEKRITALGWKINK